MKLSELQDQLGAELGVSGSTVAVKNLQMIALQKAIMAVGMFSIFEAMLQDSFGGRNGFDALRRVLEREREATLLARFNWFALAINVLKHGNGRSYELLLADADALPFRIKRPDEAFFFEGDSLKLPLWSKLTRLSYSDALKSSETHPLSSAVSIRTSDRRTHRLRCRRNHTSPFHPSLTLGRSGLEHKAKLLPTTLSLT